MATLYIEERVRRLITPLDTAISLGVGLDNIEAEVSNEEPPFMTIQSGRLRHVAAQPAESAAWPGVVVTRDRKSVVLGKSVSVRVNLGGRRMIKKKTQENQQ